MNDLEKTRQVLEYIFNSDPMLRNLFTTVSPSYRYFHHNGSKNQYFWTTEPVKHKGKLRYASGIYKYLNTRKLFKLTREMYHAKRKDAKTRALKLYEKIY